MPAQFFDDVGANWRPFGLPMGDVANQPLARLSIPALLFVCLAATAIAVAVDMRFLAGPSQLFDEGVYWESLRSMSAGYPLYAKIFDSQPPLFLATIYPFYKIFGSSITSARLGVAALSLLSIPGAYLVGRALGGRVGGITASLLLIATPMYLAQSSVLEAEGPSTAFLFLTVGAGLMWWEHPTGRKGIAFSALCGATLALGILTKLLVVTAVPPILADGSRPYLAMPEIRFRCARCTAADRCRSPRCGDRDADGVGVLYGVSKCDVCPSSNISSGSKGCDDCLKG